MYRAIVKQALDSYGVLYGSVGSTQKGYRNESYPVYTTDGRILNLLFYKREPGIVERITFADGVAAYLEEAGMPVRTRADPRVLQLQTDSGYISYAVLYHYLPGATIPWEAYSKKHIKLLGWAMSDIHARLQSMPLDDKELPLVTDQLTILLDEMQKYIKEPLARSAVRAKLGMEIDPSYVTLFKRLVNKLKDHPDQQALHMDMVRGNVLFAEAHENHKWQIGNVAISGIIDFEKAAVGHPLLEIARTLAFLLVDCGLKDAGDVKKYFLRSGYNRRGKSHYDPNGVVGSMTHSQILHGLTGLYLLHDLYKLLRHTPYESLSENHHYIRTRDILIDYGMIRYC